MPSILTSKDARPLLKLDFCYLCGHSIDEADIEAGKRSEDHVPSQKLFAEKDRNYPIKLPTHKTCNNNQSNDDEDLSNLIGAIHNSETKSLDKLTIQTKAFEMRSGFKVRGLHGDHMNDMIWRWIRGFHTALYKEFMPPTTLGYIRLPWPMVTEQSGKTTARQLFLDDRKQIANELKIQRHFKTYDCIECRNGMCRFHIAWEQLAEGNWASFFALRIYDWERIGSHPDTPDLSCVGSYVMDEKPKLATAKTVISPKLLLLVSNMQTLDPFGN